MKGKINEVKTILRSAAEMNKIELPDNLDKLLKPPITEESNQSVSELFKSKYLRLITFCFLCIWFTMNLVYYGLVLNMNTFGGNIYLNSVNSVFNSLGNLNINFNLHLDFSWTSRNSCNRISDVHYYENG